MPDLPTWNPRDHYWIVAGDESQLWSSAAHGYVAAASRAYLDWRAAGGVPTRIANEFELDAVLRKVGLALGRVFTDAEALAALSHIDAAKAKAALGREDLSAAQPDDSDKLARLAVDLHGAGVAPEIEGATKPDTLEQRLRRLEDARSVRPQ